MSAASILRELKMFGGGYEWIIFLVIALLLFGKRLPSVMRSVGSSITEFKRGMNEVPADESGNQIDNE